MKKTESCDIFVSGGGLVGLTAADALADAGKTVVIGFPHNDVRDARTTALLAHSTEFLKNIGLWDQMSVKSHPLKIMRLVDATSRLLRFPQMDFHASEIGEDAFGYNLRNQDMIDALASNLKTRDNVTVLDCTLAQIETCSDGRLRLTLNSGSGKHIIMEAGFLVGADGRNSTVRQHFGHGEKCWFYDQAALVTDFRHELSSGSASTEFHTEDGPFTIVPQTDNIAGLVWLQKPEQATEISKLHSDDLNRLLEQKMHSYLGKISVLNRPNTFPMSAMTANRFGANNHVLIGEAAHVFPPIGAQGFNLGIRDIEELVSILTQTGSAGNIGEQYDSARRSDIQSRTLGVDLLNRSLLTDFLPVQMLRYSGIMALRKFPPLRKHVMKMGIAPNFSSR